MGEPSPFSAGAVDRLARAVPKLKCPACQEFVSSVIRSVPDDAGTVYKRERKCGFCGFIYATEERISAAASQS